MPLFQIIQGGMGVGVSNWRLARTVARSGQLGVVSGTGLAPVLARRLQMGDLDGQMRHALAHFPVPGVAERILKRYFIEGGKSATASLAPTRLPQLHETQDAMDLTVAGNFAEVFLAKEGHAGVVGINYLEKIQIPHLASLFGAMLAGVDYVLMGAGIPRFIPGVLDVLAAGEPATYRMDVEEAEGHEFIGVFDPAAFWADMTRGQNPAPMPPPPPPALKRPGFIAVISSAVLALTLARKSNGQVDGFIIEGNTAGGHNAPPRGPLQLNERGEPIYGVRDIADLEKIRALGLPFWLAGGFGRPGKLAEALALGAAGIQVGTAFAFCEESGIEASLKRRAIDASLAGTADVFTDPAASPTGFPIKIMQLAGTLSEAAVFESRTRVCDVGYLRRAYRKPDGSLGYRCPAEPVKEYVRKGGKVEDTVGRKCLCNGLFANVGLGQHHRWGPEPALMTAGDDAADLRQFVQEGRHEYTAEEVLRILLEPAAVPGPVLEPLP